MKTCSGRTLEQRIEEHEYHPEIYIYPTPRMYRPLHEVRHVELIYTKRLNVYIHVPFCTHFCTFCGYFKTIYNEALQEEFVDAVLSEIRMRAAAFKDKLIRTLHFGGGTPSLLTAKQLQKILNALREVRPDILETCEEVSMEATPESIEGAKFRGYQELGVNRVSMGVQSLVDAEVALANRCLEKDRSSFRMLQEAFDTLRGCGLNDIVVDLMIGIEGQTRATFLESLEKTITLRPRTVQLYALGVMPQSALGRRQPTGLLSGREIYACYQTAYHLLTDAGYRRDSHDRYTLHPVNGFLQGDLNIQGTSLIGLGAGARSYSEGLHFRNIYSSQNGRKALMEYIRLMKGGLSAVESGVHLTLDERCRQYAIGHLRELNLNEFARRFGEPFQVKFSSLYESMLRLELASVEDSVLKLSDRGLLFRDLIARQLFSQEADERERVYRA